MIDLSDPQDDIEISEHKEPMAFAIPPVTNKLLNAPLTVSQTVQEPETTVLGRQGAEQQTSTSAIDCIEEYICHNTDVMKSVMSEIQVMTTGANNGNRNTGPF